ncbi:ribosome maturation factor RimM [Sporosalibacterium faouarense]|uniref:ribosome maturation factor RimM n=1 Tax=Sporosalibacterium faouarense TaxID=516123 RepID=UPI00141C48B3|nr:ribosome maturation factor RimM [Sporosalibacterium faouarense]MTI47685.1 ribosome maturation factor RimM [Bacillota bacterium]
MSEYLQIGKIVNTHGIRGDLKVIPLTDDTKRFEDLDTIYIENEKEVFNIEKVWYKKNLVMIKFKGYDNVNDVLKFKNRFLLIDKKDAVELPENTFFIHDIIGLKVFTVDGEEIGLVKDVLQPGSNDVYVVKTKGKDALIPAIKDVVKEVNIQEKKIVIDPIEGMIE